MAGSKRAASRSSGGSSGSARPLHSVPARPNPSLPMRPRVPRTGIRAFHSDAVGVVHMKVDAEGGRRFRWSPQTHPPAAPSGDVLFGGNGGVTNQGIVDIQRDSHTSTISFSVWAGRPRMTTGALLAQTVGARRRIRSISHAWVPVAAGPVASSSGWLCT